MYSCDGQELEKRTGWDGVSKQVALKDLRGMKPGDGLITDHTGDEKSAVGTATVVSIDTSEAKNPQIKIKFGRAIARPVTLAEVKSSNVFADSPLVRQGRLSVVPLTDPQYKFLTGE